MNEIEQLFGGPLQPDARYRLPGSVPIPARKFGPLPRIEFTIELVGPYSVPASAAARLLDQDWYLALGQPKLWAMRPSDTHWETLSGDKNGSYDSLALSWPILGADGELKTRAAVLLEKTVEPFAAAINRRSVSMPRAEDVDYLGMDLRKASAMLDIGLCLTYIPARGTISEADIWRTCRAHNLSFAPDGTFVWNVSGTDLPLFEVLPLGPVPRFSLGNVQASIQHPGLTIGIHIPVCPNPEKAIEGALRLGRNLCESYGGMVTDDSDRFVDSAIAKNLIEECQHAVRLLLQAKLPPGSAECVRLFGQ